MCMLHNYLGCATEHARYHAAVFCAYRVQWQNLETGPSLFGRLRPRLPAVSIHYTDAWKEGTRLGGGALELLGLLLRLLGGLLCRAQLRLQRGLLCRHLSLHLRLHLPLHLHLLHLRAHTQAAHQQCEWLHQDQRLPEAQLCGDGHLQYAFDTVSDQGIRLAHYI